MSLQRLHECKYVFLTLLLSLLPVLASYTDNTPYESMHLHACVVLEHFIGVRTSFDTLLLFGARF